MALPISKSVLLDCRSATTSVIEYAQPLVQGILAYGLLFWRNVGEDRRTLGQILVRGEPPVIFIDVDNDYNFNELPTRNLWWR